MSNIFEKNAIHRNDGHKKIGEFTVIDEAEIEEKRTTLSLSLTVSDKKALKIMAAEKETTIAAIIHEWIKKTVNKH